jgi:nitroreductase
VETLAGYKGFIMGDVINGPRAKIASEWAMRQLYIALGNFMTSAAMLGIDTCPLEGIQPPEYDKILGLEAKGFATTVAAAAGYRAADDKYATLPKVRFDAKDIVEHV